MTRKKKKRKLKESARDLGTLLEVGPTSQNKNAQQIAGRDRGLETYSLLY